MYLDIEGPGGLLQENIARIYISMETGARSYRSFFTKLPSIAFSSQDVNVITRGINKKLEMSFKYFIFVRLVISQYVMTESILSLKIFKIQGFLKIKGTVGTPYPAGHFRSIFKV